MSLKKSEQPLVIDRGAAGAAVAGTTDHFASRGALGAGFSPWMQSLIANAPLPLLLAGVAVSGYLLDQAKVDPYYFRIVMLIGFNIILAVSLQLINGFSGQFSLGHAGFMAVGAYLAAYPTIHYADKFQNGAMPLWFFITLGIVGGIVAGVLYGIFSLIRLSRRLHSSLPAIAILIVFAWLLADISMEARSYAGSWWLAWSRSFELISRLFAWLIESGAPIAGKVSAAIPEFAREPVCFLILIIGAGCCAAAAGFIVGLPALRLRGDYLAIATLGMAEIIRIMIQNSPPLGGALGLTNIPKHTNFAWLFGTAIVTTFVIWRVAYSPQGRAIVAVREDEIAASACGVSTTGRKVTAFVLGAFFGGVAGALFALHERSITPGYFNMTKSIEVVVMVTLGGLGSISGAILAAAVLTILPELLREPPSIGFWGWVVVIGICAVVYTVMLIRRRRKHLEVTGAVLVIALLLTIIPEAILQFSSRNWSVWIDIARLSTVVVACVLAAVAGWMVSRQAASAVIVILFMCAMWDIIQRLAIQYGIRLSEFRMIIYSLSLVFMMLLRPQGLLGGRELWPKRLGNSGRLPTPTEDRQDAAAVVV